MADRGEQSPIAPRRTLAGPSSNGSGGGEKPSLSERVSAMASAASTAVQQAVTSSPSTGTPTAGGRARVAPAPGAPLSRGRGPRRARLRLVHVDPWSVMKTAFLLSVAIGIVTVVAVAVVWGVLGAAGVWDSINQTVTSVLGSGSSSFDVQNYVGPSRVLGFTMIVAVVDVILITAISTLGAFLYNLSAQLLGGLEITFAEDDR
ncbi:MAG: DUF3566 domain-containing protein [Nocardioidaceae bacterium]